jgi:hypothetical protein
MLIETAYFTIDVAPSIVIAFCASLLAAYAAGNIAGHNRNA